MASRRAGSTISAPAAASPSRMRRSKAAGNGSRSAVDQRHRSCLRRSANRGEARGLLGEAPRQRREQRLDDRRAPPRRAPGRRRASAPARWCRGSRSRRRCAGCLRRSRFRRPVRRREARRSASSSPARRTASAPCNTMNNASEGPPCATSICPRTRSWRTMALNVFSRCSELSVRNSAKSSDTFPHPSVALGPLIGDTRFDCTCNAIAGRP